MPFVVWALVLFWFVAGFLCGVSFAAAGSLPLVLCAAVLVCVLVIVVLAQRLADRGRFIVRMEREQNAELRRRCSARPSPRAPGQWRGVYPLPPVGRVFVSGAEAARGYAGASRE